MSVIIRLQNLPMSANASNIRRFFGGLAIPEGGVHIVGGTDGDAFIAFATDEDARKAMLLDRQVINGAPVRLFLSSKTEMQSVIDSARNSALFSTAVSTPSQPIVQKTETMQALDVTAPTLPSSFPSYRNDTPRDVNPIDRQDHFGFSQKRQPSPLQPPPVRQTYEIPRGDSYENHNRSVRPPDRPTIQPEITDRDYGFDRQPPPHYTQYEVPRDHRTPVDYSAPAREANGFDLGKRGQPHPYPPYYGDTVYDRRPEGDYPPRVKDGPRSDVRAPFPDNRVARMPSDPSNAYPTRSPSHPADRFTPIDRNLRDPRDGHLDTSPHPPFQESRTRPTYPYDREPPVAPPRSQIERDFSVRPPWLNEEPSSFAPKRPPPPVETDDYPPKRRPLPNTRPQTDKSVPSETEFVVRLTLPIGEVGIKPIFEVLRGVHIVPKWGIRIEEDVLQRPTGYIFIMMCERESFDRALSFNGRFYKSRPIRVVSSTPSEFYRVTDSNFHLKCPPEIAKKLPSADQHTSPPHHNDGCLEVADLPPDSTQAEVVRFLGAPGLTASDVTIASFAPADKTATKTPGSVRALVSLPSAKDLEILLSAKARPLRPDGAFPPVRLTPISRVQLEAYSMLSMGDKQRPPVLRNQPAEQDSSQENQKITGAPLTCAYLSGFARPLNEPDVLRLFPSVLIPGDAIHLVGPENTSAYVDFISENNCRRAVEDVTGNNSKAKLAHNNIRIEAITRADMESRRAGSTKPPETVVQNVAEHRQIRPREQDPRVVIRPHWETRPPPRLDRHPSPAPPFQPRAQPIVRPKFEEPYFDHSAPFNDAHPVDPYSGPMRRPRPPIDLPASGPPPVNDYSMPPRPIEVPPPPRRPGIDFVTVHLSNLPPSVTVDQLAGIMRDYYFVPGSIRLRRDIQGVPTGEALVDFNSAYDGDRVIRDLTGYRLVGRPIMLRYDRRV